MPGFVMGSGAWRPQHHRKRQSGWTSSEASDDESEPQPVVRTRKKRNKKRQVKGSVVAKHETIQGSGASNISQLASSKDSSTVVPEASPTESSKVSPQPSLLDSNTEAGTRSGCGKVLDKGNAGCSTLGLGASCSDKRKPKLKGRKPKTKTTGKSGKPKKKIKKDKKTTC
mmetsp:Transcript_110029/g.194501  ORF Transcript_110029/g.194501 Transcript_110029/m.194501 type:complete len:170 (+) Transcript_110029:30-539(+)